MPRCVNCPPAKSAAAFHTKDAYRLIRILERKPAGRKALAEVQDTIRQLIEEKLLKEAMRKVLVEAYQHASVETTYLAPDEIGPPADIADLPARPKKETDSSKKRHDRS